jgi:hypothetical protein
MPKISAQSYLLNLGFSKDQIDEVPLSQIESWSKILSQEPLDQKIVRDFILNKIMAISVELGKPRTLMQSVASFFRLDPQQAYLKAQLGILSELYKLFGYDPDKAHKDLTRELKLKAQ